MIISPRTEISCHDVIDPAWQFIAYGLFSLCVCVCFRVTRGLGDNRFGIPLEKVQHDGASSKESAVTTVQPRVVHHWFMQLQIAYRFVNQQPNFDLHGVNSGALSIAQRTVRFQLLILMWSLFHMRDQWKEWDILCRHNNSKNPPSASRAQLITKASKKKHTKQIKLLNCPQWLLPTGSWLHFS